MDWFNNKNMIVTTQNSSRIVEHENSLCLFWYIKYIVIEIFVFSLFQNNIYYLELDNTSIICKSFDTGEMKTVMRSSIIYIDDFRTKNHQYWFNLFIESPGRWNAIFRALYFIAVYRPADNNVVLILETAYMRKTGCEIAQYFRKRERERENK